MSLFFGNIYKNWATFYSSIWPHCTQSIIAYQTSIRSVKDQDSLRYLDWNLKRTPNCDCFHDLKKSFLLCPISIFFFVATSYCPESRRIEEAAIDLRTSDEMMMMTTTTIDIGGGSKEKVKKSQFKVSQFVSLRLYMTQYTYHLATPGSNPKHTIYAFLI